MAWGEVLKVFDLKPRHLFVVWIFGTFLLLAPQSISDRLGFTSIVNGFRGWIGLVTLALLILWSVQLWTSSSERRRSEKEAKAKAEAEAEAEADSERHAQREALDSLTTLSRNERLVIMYALYRGQQTVFTKFADQAAQALCSKGLLIPAPQGDAFNFPFTIPNFVWRQLQKHKSELLPKEILPQFAEWVERFESRPDWGRSFE